MKISPKLRKLLDNQIALEANASNYYLSMASWCEFTGYEGAAMYFFNQSDEERQHMLKIIHFINGRGGTTAEIPQVKKSPSAFKSLEGLIKTALKNEQAVTMAITKMVELASKEKDHATFTFLQWFVNEQMQEEEKFETLLQKFELIGRDKIAINEIDRIMGSTPVDTAVQ